MLEQNLKQTNVKGWKPKSERMWKVCQSVAIKTQTLSEVDSNENETGSLKA